ncbi:MAG: hypothetical protein H5T98_09465 [Syntrophomonadaceae bacterium]|nr:hypothetical protein [Syntrophomonadaceae bacterium]
MRLPSKILLPAPVTEYEKQLNRILYRDIEDISKQVNDLTEGRIFADHSAMTAKPTTGTYFRGDVIRNSALDELGSNIPKYVILGWACVVSGTPGTWVEIRAKTGGGVDFSKLLTGSATIDFASIAAGAVATADIAITGAAAGDFVTLSAPAALEAGLTFCGIANTDKVTIRLHNTTGAAIDPASATWKALVEAV